MKPQRYKILPRGFRNNNPLNIRIGNVWLGEVQVPTDPDFEQFVSMAYGIRAAFVLLRRYIRHYRRTTVPQVIAAWAPSTENNTTAYVDRVCSLSHIDPDATLHYEDREQMVQLISAMILVECGQPVSVDIIQRAYTMT